MNLRKLLLILLTLVLMLVFTLTSSALLVLGDSDGNGTVDVIDFIAFSRYLSNFLGYDEKVNTAVLDINADGEVDALDASIQARHIAGWKGYNDLYEFNPDFNGETNAVEPVKDVSLSIRGMYIATTITPPDNTDGVSGYEMYFYDSRYPESRQHSGVNTTFESYLTYGTHFKSEYTYDKLDVVTLTNVEGRQNATRTFDISIRCAGGVTPEISSAEFESEHSAKIKFNNLDSGFVLCEYYSYDGNTYTEICSNYNYIENAQIICGYDGDASLVSSGNIYVKFSGIDAEDMPGENSIVWKKINDTGYIHLEPYTVTEPEPDNLGDAPITGVYFEDVNNVGLLLKCEYPADTDILNYHMKTFISKDNVNWIELNHSEPYDDVLVNISDKCDLLSAGEYKYLKIETTPTMSDGRYNDYFADIDLTVNETVDEDITASILKTEGGSFVYIASGFDSYDIIHLVVYDVGNNGIVVKSQGDTTNSGTFAHEFKLNFDGNIENLRYNFSSYDVRVKNDGDSATFTKVSYGADKEFKLDMMTQDSSLVSNFRFTKNNYAVLPSFDLDSTNLCDKMFFATKDSGDTWANLGKISISLPKFIDNSNYDTFRVVATYSDGTVKYCDVDVNIQVGGYENQLGMELSNDRSTITVSNIPYNGVPGAFAYEVIKSYGSNTGSGTLSLFTGSTYSANVNIRNNALALKCRFMQATTVDGTTLKIASTGWQNIDLGN